MIKKYLKYKFYKIHKNGVFKKTTNIFIACFPKSGSTYLAILLSKVTGFKILNAMQFAKHNEQDIYKVKLRKFLSVNSVTQQHARGTENNVGLLIKYNIKPIILVRNIFDTLISYYDHLENEDYRVPMGFVHKEYFNMARQEKLDFLIKVHLPWYFNFLMSWREASKDINTLWITYDQLFTDQTNTIQKILKFYKLSRSNNDIKSAIATIKKRKTRFNIGISGRGKLISEQQKREIVNLARVWKVKSRELELIGI